MNCPFYGRRLVALESEPPFLLFNQRGNQCALCTASHSPCDLEIDQRPVDWRACERIRAIRDDVDADARELRAATCCSLRTRPNGINADARELED